VSFCSIASVNRAGYYRWLQPRAVDAAEAGLQDAIQRIALEFPAYGYRRVTAELHRRGRKVNHKRVLRLMREDNLLALRRKSFLSLTNSAHRLQVYPNVAAMIAPSGPNQLWVADITYIRLRHEFVYLAVILDSWSRLVVGWALGRTLEAQLAVSALNMAIEQRQPQAGLVHHSDRGIQYACNDYTSLLEAHQIGISMSRTGNPYDNAQAESFMKTLKYEEIYRNEYLGFDDALTSIGEFINVVYNERRLHSSLGYKPPAEFERTATLPAAASAAAAV
jgi:putative transposase